MSDSSIEKLPGAHLRQLKAIAQKLEPVVMVGKQGLSPEMLRNLGEELNRRELVKVKFMALKDQKKELSVELAEKTGSHLVMRVGHVAVLFRRNPDPEERKIKLG